MTRHLTPWVRESDLTDDKDLLNLKLPTGVTMPMLCDAATDYLWRAAGAVHEVFTQTIRPSRLTSDCDGAAPLLGPLDGRPSHAFAVRELALEGPASEISVVVDGIELPESSWTLIDGYRLIRTDGYYWPCCQDLSRPDGSVGTWSVTHAVGHGPPSLGRLAARELVKQLALYHSGRDSKLPAGTTQVTRAGISINLDRPKRSNGGDPGTSGLPTVELFLDAVNPRRHRRPLVISPDTLVGGRTS